MEFNYLESMSEKEMAGAFEKIAKNFYCQNFGTMPKSEIELLMFSILYDKMYEQGKENVKSYNMSKILGITQNRVDSLKERKSTRESYNTTTWKTEIASLCDNIRVLGDKKVSIYIQERSLYFEIKNIIESACGIVDMSLNNFSVMTLSIQDYLILTYECAEDDEKKKIEKEIQKICKKNEADLKEQIVGKSPTKILKEAGIGFAKDIITSLMTNNPIGVATSAGKMIKAVYSCIK